MPLDPAIITRDVHIELLDNEGNPRAGTLTFRNSRMTNGEQLIPEDDVVATLNGSGEATVTLIANLNNPEISPNGSYYRVTEQLDGGFTNTRFIQVDGALPEPIEYAGILDATPLPVGSTFVTQAQLIQAVEDAITELGFDPDQFAKLVGASPITGMYSWVLPIETDETLQISAIEINNDNDVNASDSPDTFVIRYKGSGDLQRTGWFNEWGGLRVRVPSSAVLGYADVAAKLFEPSTGGEDGLQIFGPGGTKKFSVRDGAVAASSLALTAGATIATTLAVTGAVTMSSTLAVTGQVTVPTTPTAPAHAASKSYVDSVAGGGGGGVPTSRLINTTAPITGGGDLSADRTLALANDGITNALLNNMAQSTIKGRAAGAGTGDPTDLTDSQVLTLLGFDYTAWTTLTGFAGVFSAHPEDASGGAPQVRVIKIFGVTFLQGSGRIDMSGSATADLDICDLPTSLTWVLAGGTVSAVPARRRQWAGTTDASGGQRLRVSTSGKLQIVGTIASATPIYLDNTAWVRLA